MGCVCVCERERERERQRQRQTDREMSIKRLNFPSGSFSRESRMSIYDVIGTGSAAILDCWQIARLRDAWAFQLVAWNLSTVFSAPFVAKTVSKCLQERKTSWKDLSCILADLSVIKWAHGQCHRILFHMFTYCHCLKKACKWTVIDRIHAKLLERHLIIFLDFVRIRQDCGLIWFQLSNYSRGYYNFVP